MNVQLTFKILGGLAIFLGLMLLTPIPFSLWYADGQWTTFLISALVTAGVGAALFFSLKTNATMTYREGFGTVTLGWILFALFGALPFIISGVIGHPIDAFFEAMSGFTTTGSTVIGPDATGAGGLAAVPKSVLFWRSLTQWLGGMGIIVLSLAILPFLGVGGMQLFEAEVPGPTADRLSPRIQDTAKLLWGVYVLVTLAEVVLLCLGEMDPFESICHALTTMATGGFSTRDESITTSSTYAHIVITIFMFLAGVNFSLHFLAFRGQFRQYLQSQEFRFYVGIIVVSVVVVTVANLGHADYEESIGKNVRDAAFMTVSVMTTTGYGTGDYETWSTVAQYLLVTLMFVGGCAGSTGGGIKVVRILLVIKHAFLQLYRLIHPREIRALRLDHKAVSPEVMQSILGFVALFFGLFLHAALIMAALGLDLTTAGGSVIACLGNIGPGLGDVGPTDNFADVPALGKLVLSACMLLGRLEIFTVLVLFFPSFWRK